MPVVDAIPVDIELSEIVRVLRLDRRAGGEEQARNLLAEAAPLFRPRAVYRPAFVEAMSADSVTIEGHVFRSRVLRVNLNHIYMVFPYVLTVGPELEAAAARSDDLLRRYSLEVLADMALEKVAEKIQGKIGREAGIARLSQMNPGSLADWPITEQVPLFNLLGDVESAIGVRLSDSLLMLPRKSVSGVFFPSAETFYSCRLCAREACPGRKAPHNPAGWVRYRLEKP
ncbi:MAG: vitamin B12 dependent-methionine synthase activation domain-containing protein [Candidatus Aminicenantales bacterium]